MGKDLRKGCEGEIMSTTIEELETFRKQKNNPIDEIEERNMYIKNIKMWTVHNQMDMMIEESSELIHAIIKTRRGQDEYKTHLIEELVDVQIMINQMKIIVNNNSMWDLMMKYKLNRLKKIQVAAMKYTEDLR